MTVCTEVTIRNAACEVEVTLTGGDDPRVTALTIVDGCIELDLQTVMLMMGHAEWNEFVDECVAIRDRHPEAVAVNPIGRSFYNGN